MTLPKVRPQGHVFALAEPFWGHTKPMCALLAKIVRLRGVHVTLFVGVSVLKKTHDELARQFVQEGEEHLRSLIRVVGLPCAPNPFDGDLFHSAFIENYRTLHDSKAISVSPDSQETHEGLAPPQLAILDYFSYEPMKAIRAISGYKLPVYALEHSSLAAVLFIFGPESMGGHGKLDEKIRKIQTEDTDALDQEAERIYRRHDEGVSEVPGIPPMYYYEHLPQIVSLGIKTSALVFFVQYAHKLLSECDGIISCTTWDFERASLEALQNWVAPHPVFAIGSPSPPASAAEIEKEVTESSVGAGVQSFMDDALYKYGPNSVIFISFGTVFWPTEPEKIWIIFDVLIEHGIPFLFSHASPVGSIPDVVAAKIKASGLGYTAKWLPQQMILQHKACGWFMSHCGHNSVIETLTAGVPLICWPYDADQPMNAANIAFVHNVGYELFEVRTGHGLRPVHRLGNKAPEGTLEAVRREMEEVLMKARGADGEMKRAKAQWFSQEFARSWEPGGSAWKELDRMLEVLA